MVARADEMINLSIDVSEDDDLAITPDQAVSDIRSDPSKVNAAARTPEELFYIAREAFRELP